MKSFVAMTPDQALKFFETCSYKEAITEKERLDILAQMAKDNEVLLAGQFDEKTSEALGEFFDKTKHKGVILVKEKDNEETSGC